MKKIIFTVAVCTALASCSREESIFNGISDIVFTAEGEGIDVSTSTKSCAAVTSLSSFNVNCVTGTLGTSETSVFNTAFTGKTSYTGGKFWPSSDAGYKFYASNVALTPNGTGATVTAPDTVDVVCAVCASPAYKASNTLTFNHIFSRLGKTTVNVQEGYTLSDFSLTITPKTGGTYNLFSGNGKTDRTGWSSVVTGAELTLATAAGENNATDCLVVPGQYELSASYTLAKGDYSVTKNNSKKSVDIVGGKINEITVNLGGASASEITLNVNITAWGDPVEKTVDFNG